MRRDENRAAHDDVAANGSRLGGRCAALAGMTVVEGPGGGQVRRS